MNFKNNMFIIFFHLSTITNSQEVLLQKETQPAVKKLGMFGLFGVKSIIAVYFSLFSIISTTFQSAAQESSKEMSTSKVHIWWHWADGNITREGITKDLESMKATGISQATIINVGYFFKDKDFGVPKVKFNSSEWHAMFSWALIEAQRLHMTIGAHQCDGWSSSGGPWITPELSMKTTTWSKSIVNGGSNVTLTLPTPFHRRNYYRDVAVFAYRTPITASNFTLQQPRFVLNDSVPMAGMTDGSHSGGIALKWGDTLKISLKKPIAIDRIAMMTQMQFNFGNPKKVDCEFTLSASLDGKKYYKVCDFVIKGINALREIKIPATNGRYFKIGFKTFPWHVSWHPISIAEIELLASGEVPLYQANIPFIQEKIIGAKNENERDFEAISSSEIIPIKNKEVVDLSSKMSKDGILTWNVPKGNWAIIRFGYTTTGVKNAPANVEGEGLECDKMDSLALQHHFSQFPQALINTAQVVPENPFKFLLVESWECGLQNWTSSFPEEFQKRRGYSLIPYLPILCGQVLQDATTSESVLYDYRKTIAELIDQNYYEQFATLCHNNKLKMHCEGIYGNEGFPPTDIIKATKYADMPMQEFWVDNDTSALPKYTLQKPKLLLAASGALFYDKKILGAEAYTAMIHFSESPWDLKRFGDAAFCSGINQFVLHSYVHQPSDKAPGLTLGNYGSSFNRLNPWFQFSKGWIQYHERIQDALQEGQMHADLLYFVGDQMPQIFSANIDTKSTSDYRIEIPQGYHAHACNFDILKNKLSVKNGKLVYKNVFFSILSLPSDMGMELTTLERLMELVGQGASVYGNRPTKMLGMHSDVASKQIIFDRMVSQFWGDINGNNITTHSYKKGKVYWGMSMEKLLTIIGVHRDFTSDGEKTDTNSFLFTHRIADQKEIYFVVNQEDYTHQKQFTFNTSKSVITAVNPIDGVRLPIQGQLKDGKIQFGFTFLPRASWIFIFENGRPLPNNFKIETAEKEILMLKQNIDLRLEPAGDNLIRPSIKINKLQTLSDFENSEIKYFSGVAHYKIKFSVDQSTLYKKMLLSLGEIGATAKVILNGQVIGHAWAPDTKFDVTKLLKMDNVLEVLVANEFRNRIIGDFREHQLLKNAWTSTDISNRLKVASSLKPSGLIGPIKIWGAK